VHLATWPVADPDLVDPVLAEHVRVARTLAEAGRAARKASGVRVRQPLGRALVGLPVDLPRDLLDDVAAELNVKRLEPLSGEVVDVRVKADFRALGRRFGKRTQRVADALHAADPHGVVAVRTGGRVRVEVDGEPLELTAAEVLVTEVPRSGLAVESQRGVTIALDVEITPALAAEGTVRDLVRVVQQARRDAGLAMADRVELTVGAPSEVLAAVRARGVPGGRGARPAGDPGGRCRGRLPRRGGERGCGGGPDREVGLAGRDGEQGERFPLVAGHRGLQHERGVDERLRPVALDLRDQRRPQVLLDAALPVALHQVEHLRVVDVAGPPEPQVALLGPGGRGELLDQA
jgi:hypothetical protein